MPTNKLNFGRAIILLCILSLPAFGASAWASEGPTALVVQSTIPPPRDVPYPGVIKLAVNATDLTQHIFRAEETIPVHSGAITLLYPEWIPGIHSPAAGRIDEMTGLTIQANGRHLDWTRDPVNMFAFHVTVPAGVRSLNLKFQFLSAGDGHEDSIIASPDIVLVQWHRTLLYPAGYYTRQIHIDASVKLPHGWKFATALDTASITSDVVNFKRTTVNTLADSSVYAGRYFQRVSLGAIGGAPLWLDIFADSPSLFPRSSQQLEAHRALVVQAERLFGSHHFAHYDFLLVLSRRIGLGGWEHHQSSENAPGFDYFTAWDTTADYRTLLPHEFIHSWNGKFRRPADLWAPNFNVPARNSLLWVYEGLTQYWCYVLAARSGLMSQQQVLDALALMAGTDQYRVGREWRSLQDTTNDAIIQDRGGHGLYSPSWQRSEDYYDEGALLWLDVDTTIRSLSGGTRSLDDFARSFFGVKDGSPVTTTYTFGDIVRALNGVQPYDWAKFLRARLDGHTQAPLGGITRGGYKLVFRDTPTRYDENQQTRDGVADLRFSIGMRVANDGRISDVMWRGPALTAGITNGTQIVAVNGLAYDANALKSAIADAQKVSGPLELLVRNGDRYSTLKVNYQGGLRYPHLERTSKPQAWLLQILQPRR